MVILIRVGFFIRCVVCTALITIVIALHLGRELKRTTPPSHKSPPSVETVNH
jgi:hypothetical protein